MRRTSRRVRAFGGDTDMCEERPEGERLEDRVARLERLLAEHAERIAQLEAEKTEVLHTLDMVCHLLGRRVDRLLAVPSTALS